MEKDKGVTLISLIITIIILLILTGISITISTRGSVSQKARIRAGRWNYRKFIWKKGNQKSYEI